MCPGRCAVGSGAWARGPGGPASLCCASTPHPPPYQAPGLWCGGVATAVPQRWGGGGLSQHNIHMPPPDTLGHGPLGAPPPAEGEGSRKGQGEGERGQWAAPPQDMPCIRASCTPPPLSWHMHGHTPPPICMAVWVWAPRRRVLRWCAANHTSAHGGACARQTSAHAEPPFGMAPYPTATAADELRLGGSTPEEGPQTTQKNNCTAPPPDFRMEHRCSGAAHNTPPCPPRALPSPFASCGACTTARASDRGPPEARGL